MPKISIVLPTFNGERYLKSSIHSILSQTFPDWELIIVDDCSTDGTADIIKHYAQSDSRIRVICNEKNQKLPGSLNIGFSVAKGEYLTWTSDDNLYLPDALAEMAACLDFHPDIFMVRCDMQIIDENGTVTGCAGTYTNEKIYTYNCLGACFLYRKEVYDQIGNYDIHTFCVEDYDYWLRILDCFGSIQSIDKILYQYRRHSGSLTETKKIQIRDQLTKLRIRYIDTILRILCKNPGELCRIYYEMKRSPFMTPEIINRFKQVVPELCNEEPFAADKKYVIFAAGNYGEEAAEQLGSQAVAFADHCTAKIGTTKCGLKVLSLPEAAAFVKKHALSDAEYSSISTESRIMEFPDDDTLSDRMRCSPDTTAYRFLIAIAGEHIYELICQLQSAGITEYCVYDRKELNR